MMEITGLILCGGRSARMGADKGSLLKDGKPWARLIYHKLSALNIPCKISVNKDQIKNYASIFPQQELIVDQLDIPGPLRGILSAHRQYPHKNWLIIACDMIDMDQETLIQILQAVNQAPASEFYVFRNETYYEPFGGIYTSTGLQQVFDLYHKNELENFSLQHLLKKSKTHTISTANNEAAFRNYNS